MADAVANFSFTHPKNYFGVPLAVASADPTDVAIEAALVGLPDNARRGARELNLITDAGELTTLGETIVNTVKAETTITNELETFRELKGSTARFIDSAPRYWNPITRHVLKNHPLTDNVVTLLEKTGPVTLPELAEIAVRNEHAIGEMLLRNPDRLFAESEPGQDPPEFLSSPDAYTGTAVYQFKNILYHCGILTERGRDTSALIPDQDIWALDPALISLGADV